MIGWHHRLHGHELGQSPGDGEGQGSLVRCTSWGQEELDRTWQLNNNRGNPKWDIIQLTRYPMSLPSLQFSSVPQSYPTLCDPMNRSMPGLPVHHQLPEFTQTHGHPVSDAIQPSHPLSSPSPPAPNPPQHQSHFQ